MTGYSSGALCSQVILITIATRDDSRIEDAQFRKKKFRCALQLTGTTQHYNNYYTTIQQMVDIKASRVFLYLVPCARYDPHRLF